MIRKILKTQDPRLRIPSKPVEIVDKKILNLIQDLKDTLTVQKDPEGVGLAAPQIGKNLKVFIMRDQNQIKTIINPEIISEEAALPNNKKLLEKEGKKDTIMEGCLSLPHYYGPLKRSQTLTLKYSNERGEQRMETFAGFAAQIIQHEIDHLYGILFIDRLLEQKKALYTQEDGEWIEVDL